MEFLIFGLSAALLASVVYIILKPKPKEVVRVITEKVVEKAVEEAASPKDIRKVEEAYLQKLIDLYVEYRWYTKLRYETLYDKGYNWKTNTPDKFRVINNIADAEDLIKTCEHVAKVRASESKLNIVDFYNEELRRARERDTYECRFEDRVKDVLESTVATLRGQIGAKYGFDSDQFEEALKEDNSVNLEALLDWDRSYEAWQARRMKARSLEA